VDRRVRPARVTDLDDLTRTHLAAFRAGNGPALAPAVLRNLTFERMRERWQQHLDDPPAGTLLLIAEHEGTVVGSAGAGPCRDDDLDAATTGELYSLYVDPRAWGAGHGAALHDAALVHLSESGLASAVLWVLEGNARARSFYAAHGWTAEGGHREWEDAPLLRLRRGP